MCLGFSTSVTIFREVPWHLPLKSMKKWANASCFEDARRMIPNLSVSCLNRQPLMFWVLLLVRGLLKGHLRSAQATNVTLSVHCKIPVSTTLVQYEKSVGIRNYSSVCHFFFVFGSFGAGMASHLQSKDIPLILYVARCGIVKQQLKSNITH